ncbi:MAG TPA: hydantoinase B/oxoprolinase family protein [Candidatus Dormibacteraeota bacterium]|nr:hydantoinase B/oxoprolinase family protein [Candidatus Dormibacteraeota bacterium]
MSETIDLIPSKLLRDLSEEEFQSIYDCDRFTATVLASRYRYIVQHMCSGLLTNAFSIILRDWYDFAATISGPPSLNYPMSAVSNSLVLFLGTMAEACRNSVEEYGPERLEPGDVLICNDPYRIGTHVNDICFIRPVFHQGKIVSFVNLQAHMLDMGGVVPAGFSGTKKNVYENGLVIPPMRLYRGDEPVASTYSLIFDNARFGALMLPDIKTIYQNLVLGERLILETIDRYGVEAYLGGLRYACDVSAETMRQALERIPDGVYEGEDAIDCDGVDDHEEFTVKVRITKRGGRAEVDLSGSSRQARTSINAGWLDAKTAVGVAFKFLLDPTSPFTSGTYRPIDIVLPPGTFVSALPPEGAIFLYWESSAPLLLAIFRALKDALGENAVGGDYGSLNIHNANGVHPDGTPWVTMAQCGGEHGPWGATKHGDADSYMVFYLANNLDPATEAIESDFPTVVLRKEYAVDTGGAGRNRGGAAVVKDTLWLTEAEQYSMPLHCKRPSGIGVYGGCDGATGGAWVFEPEAFDVVAERDLVPVDDEIYRRSTPVAGVLDPGTYRPDPKGSYFYFARIPIWRTRSNTVFRYLTNGGGWGNPLEREPGRVLRDVRDGYVSIEGARRDYGVVVVGDPERDPEGLRVDEAATAALRQTLAAKVE